jgi:transmembrane sensor
MDHPFPDDTFLARWLAGTLTDAELAAFKARPDYPEFQQIVSEISDLDIPQRDKVQQFAKLRQRMTPPARGRYYLTRRQWLLGAAAAVVGMLLVAAYWTFLPGLPKTYRTAAAQQRTVTLPDQSVVILNAESQVGYRAGEWLQARNVQLQGEAFFNVKEGNRPFTVQTEAGQITVLGTTFNVRARAGQLTVQCYEGSVGVRHQQVEQTLKAGEQIQLADGNVTLATPLAGHTDHPDWTRGTTTYKSWTTQEVLAELARQYDKKLDWQATTNPVISGGFPHDQLEVALQIVCQSANMNCTITNAETIRVIDQ